MYKTKPTEANYIANNQQTCEKRTYTVDEIQNILGISKSTAYSLVKSEAFKCINVGRHIRVSKKSFDEWLDEQE